MSELLPLDDETRSLAAMAYGEGSIANDRKEMFALASVLHRQMKARGYTSIRTFGVTDRTFSFVTSDGNDRYKQLMHAKPETINQDNGMKTAVMAARNAMCGGEDFSNGAYFWDGADIKSNYSNHFKVKHGIQFTEPQHNIYGVQPSTMKTVFLYRNKKSRINGKTVIEKQLIDSADHVYESTAAYGGTIFWKQSTHYLNVTRAKPWL